MSTSESKKKSKEKQRYDFRHLTFDRMEDQPHLKRLLRDLPLAGEFSVDSGLFVLDAALIRALRAQDFLGVCRDDLAEIETGMLERCATGSLSVMHKWWDEGTALWGAPLRVLNKYAEIRERAYPSLPLTTMQTLLACPETDSVAFWRLVRHLAETGSDRKVRGILDAPVLKYRSLRALGRKCYRKAGERCGSLLVPGLELLTRLNLIHLEDKCTIILGKQWMPFGRPKGRLVPLPDCPPLVSARKHRGAEIKGWYRLLTLFATQSGARIKKSGGLPLMHSDAGVSRKVWDYWYLEDYLKGNTRISLGTAVDAAAMRQLVQGKSARKHRKRAAE